MSYEPGEALRLYAPTCEQAAIFNVIVIDPKTGDVLWDVDNPAVPVVIDNRDPNNSSEISLRDLARRFYDRPLRVHMRGGGVHGAEFQLSEMRTGHLAVGERPNRFMTAEEFLNSPTCESTPPTWVWLVLAIGAMILGTIVAATWMLTRSQPHRPKG